MAEGSEGLQQEARECSAAPLPKVSGMADLTRDEVKLTSFGIYLTNRDNFQEQIHFYLAESSLMAIKRTQQKK